MQTLRSRTLHKSWLLVTAMVIGSFGPVFFLGSMLPTSELARLTLDLLAWPVDGQQTFVDPTLRFLSAVTGGFLLGWGMTVWGLRRWVYDIAPEAVRRVVVLGILSWCLLDSAGSIAAGVWSNALFNLIVLVIAVGPLWWKAHD